MALRTAVVILGVLTSTLAAIACLPAPGEPSAGDDVIEQLTRAKISDDKLDRFAGKFPMEIGSADQAAAVIDNWAQIERSVDLDLQKIVVFAWEGSGQDRMDFAILESYPEQIIFEVRPGATKDIRSHVKVFAIRKLASWSLRGDDELPAGTEFVRLEMQGTLNAEVFAIGGETTGIVITANDVTFELDFAGKRRLERRARELDGTLVNVKGELTRKQGVEIKERWIIEVDSIRPVKGFDPNETVSSDGSEIEDPEDGEEDIPGIDEPQGQSTPGFDPGAMRGLKVPVVLRDSQSGFVGQSGFVVRIDTDGTWSRRPFVNEDELEASATGKLDMRQLAELAKLIERTRFDKLPKKLGKDPGVNPHEISIRMGDHIVTWGATGGQPLTADGEDGSPLNRFARLGLSIIKATEAKDR